MRHGRGITTGIAVLIVSCAVIASPVHAGFIADLREAIGLGGQEKGGMEAVSGDGGQRNSEPEPSSGASEHTGQMTVDAVGDDQSDQAEPAGSEQSD